MKLLLLGAPGSGKGTQSKLLVEKFGYTHLAMGDILRQEVSEQTDLGLEAKSFMNKGELVPDSVVNAMIIKRVSETKNENGLILDGFPRTLEQAIFIDKKGVIFDKVIYLDLGLDDVLDRMAGRLTCTKCGSSFHQKYNSPKIEGICDQCSSSLIIRDDDKPETVEKRFNTFLSLTKPLLEYYTDKGNTLVVNAGSDIDKLTQEIVSAIK
jgi:adenylate kinase